jgi:2'-5' RNA ligase
MRSDRHFEWHSGRIAPRFSAVMSEQANWFVGLPVSPSGWFEAVGPPPPFVRLFAPTDVHVTVAFLGRVTEEAARAAWAATAWDDGPVDVTFGNVVPMGSPRHWSALSVLLASGREGVEAGIGRHRGAPYAAAGAEPDDRPPLAHVTIGRLKRNADRSARARARAWAESIVLPNRMVRLDRIALYTWSDDRAETLFRIVEAAPVPRRG